VSGPLPDQISRHTARWVTSGRSDALGEGCKCCGLIRISRQSARWATSGRSDAPEKGCMCCCLIRMPVTTLLS
jgi:hypothetical protein